MKVEDMDQLMRVTATAMASTAALTLRWAGNGLLALVTVMTVVEWTVGVDVLSLAFACAPGTLWITSWVVSKRKDRFADLVVAQVRKRAEQATREVLGDTQ